MIVGVIGGGQLGRMLALSGIPLGLRFVVIEQSVDCPAGEVAEILEGNYADLSRLAELAEVADVVTFEFENVPTESVQYLQQHVAVYPPPAALQVAQDRLFEKQLFNELGIPLAAFHAVDSREDLHRAVDDVGLRAILKTRRFGYDGKGQFVLHEPADVDAAWNQLGGVPLVLEQFIHFERELAIVAVRSRDGEMATYPVVETHHRGGILDLTLAPADDLDDTVADTARDYVKRIMERLDYVGVLALELFDRGGSLFANEIAPRVHNSGHWTIDGAVTSQFENHVRAICGLPLGSTAQRCPTAMVNFIGSIPELAGIAAIPGAHPHLYGKEPRAGRKLGHINITADSRELLTSRIEQVRRLQVGDE